MGSKRFNLRGKMADFTRAKNYFGQPADGKDVSGGDHAGNSQAMGMPCRGLAIISSTRRRHLA